MRKVKGAPTGSREEFAVPGVKVAVEAVAVPGVAVGVVEVAVGKGGRTEVG